MIFRAPALPPQRAETRTEDATPDGLRLWCGAGYLRNGTVPWRVRGSVMAGTSSMSVPMTAERSNR